MAAIERQNSRILSIAPLPSFDPLLAFAALVVEGDDTLGAACHVAHRPGSPWPPRLIKHNVQIIMPESQP
jgi:hypothetical protein